MWFSQSSSDKMVLLPAVRCPHCRHFAPTYEKLAQALKDDPDILVTRLDVTDESIPEDILMAFPVRTKPSMLINLMLGACLLHLCRH